MKLIFLDIDGVMNSQSGKEPYLADMEIEKLLLLKSLAEDTKGGVVLISDRRWSDSYLGEFRNALEHYQIPYTGKLNDSVDDEETRGQQILDFLSGLNEEVERIVILDDNDYGISSLFEDNFILVNKYFGLNEEVVKRAKDILNS